jgi:DNA (cytosine-5)-methyltransferase 1
MFDFYEFFAGGGMARTGLAQGWRCLFANDMDEKKAAAYQANFNDALELTVCDVAALTVDNLPSVADLAWASFPCQDLSLAGQRGGLGAERSGAFWPFWRLIQGLVSENRAPSLIVLENVCGALTSHGGQDFLAIAETFTQAGYRFGAVVIDAVYFLPQSRPRLFIIGVKCDLHIPPEIKSSMPHLLWHPVAIRERVSQFSVDIRHRWIWWRLPVPPTRTMVFADVIESEPQGVSWHTQEETHRLLGLMSEINRAKVSMAQATGRRMVGGVYKRTRNGAQRAEVRFDDVAGCLRTPSGGSSRQTILILEGANVCSRLLSPREAARLMGLPESYRLPKKYNDAYHLVGDGLAVPVIRHLAANILEPILICNRSSTAARHRTSTQSLAEYVPAYIS